MGKIDCAPDGRWFYRIIRALSPRPWSRLSQPGAGEGSPKQAANGFAPVPAIFHTGFLCNQGGVANMSEPQSVALACNVSF